MKRQTTVERATIANAIRNVDVMTASREVRHWKVEAEHLLEVFDQDDNVSDLISTLVFYGYVLGIETVLTDLKEPPFDTDANAGKINSAWQAIRKEYVLEMRKGVGREDVDN